MLEYNKVEFSQVDSSKIAEAIDLILKGKCSKVIVSDNVKVYQCKNIIRIDLKIKED